MFCLIPSVKQVRGFYLVYTYRNGNKKVETFEEKTGTGFPHLESGLVHHEFNDETVSRRTKSIPSRGKP